MTPIVRPWWAGPAAAPTAIGAALLLAVVGVLARPMLIRRQRLERDLPDANGYVSTRTFERPVAAFSWAWRTLSSQSEVATNERVLPTAVHRNTADSPPRSVTGE